MGQTRVLLDERAELFVAYLAVGVLVQVEDRPVHDLLQLRVSQVLAGHHLEHLEELPVGDVSVAVHVVDAEEELKLGLSVLISHGELRESEDKLCGEED